MMMKLFQLKEKNRMLVVATAKEVNGGAKRGNVGNDNGGYQ